MSLRAIQSLYGSRIAVRCFSRSVVHCQEIGGATGGESGVNTNTSQESKIDTESGRPLIPKSLLKTERGAGLIISGDLGTGVVSNPQLDRLRVVPTLPTFYGGNPIHEQNLNHLNAVLRKYINLPTTVVDAKAQAERKFISYEEYKERLQAGTRLKPIHHKELTSILHRLRSIEPQLMPVEVLETLDEFTKASNVLAQKAQKAPTLDEMGRSVTDGRRKTSKARVFLTKGTGEVIVNGKPFMEYFPRIDHRSRINYPFQVVSQEGQFNIFAEVVGGGISGQCEAVMYGVAKGLVVHNPLFKTRLHSAGLMTRDTRKVERKKPGKLKARKMPAWVKR
ncbi:37S ribosomal protein S9, mitochondrial [[Candida] anglica]